MTDDGVRSESFETNRVPANGMRFGHSYSAILSLPLVKVALLSYHLDPNVIKEIGKI